ncbi:MAG: hypothetical protein IPJ41_17835 [Phycisphaerales bacterium]|nr:hypothetical protein [Phycisphaerales bacterium]
MNETSREIKRRRKALAAEANAMMQHRYRIYADVAVKSIADGGCEVVSCHPHQVTDTVISNNIAKMLGAMSSEDRNLWQCVWVCGPFVLRNLIGLMNYNGSPTLIGIPIACFDDMPSLGEFGCICLVFGERILEIPDMPETPGRRLVQGDLDDCFAYEWKYHVRTVTHCVALAANNRDGR